jgi:hypothetical protein
VPLAVATAAGLMSAAQNALVKKRKKKEKD